MFKPPKKVIMSALLAILILFFSNGCSDKDMRYKVSDENSIILRLAESQPSSYPSAQGDMEFARLVELKSGGRIKVKIYDSAKLGDEASVIEQVQFGGIDLARVNLASLVQYVPEIGIMTLPYIFRSSDHMWKVAEGPIGENFKESLLKEGFACLCWYEGGSRGFFNSKRDINSVEDLKGLKISVPRSQLIMDVYSYLGVSLVPTKSNDIYSALQKGFIDGSEDNIITYYSSKCYEVAKHLTYDNHSYIPELIVASRTTMNQLPKDDQELIEEAAKESAIFQRSLWLVSEKKALDALKGLDVSITYPSEERRNDFLTAVKPLYDSLRNDIFNSIINTTD